MIREKFGDNPTIEETSKFYKNLDWNNFLEECEPISNALENLQKLIDSNLYDVTVLTHVHSLHEEEVKEEYLKKYVPGLKFISVMKPNPKWGAIDCKDTILVDDYGGNLKEWEEHGGISVKFSLKDKKYDYVSIKSLDELIELYPDFKKSIKKKVKV